MFGKRPSRLLEAQGVESRYVSLALGMLCEFAAGTGYAFGIYSQQLKTEMGYSQSDLNTISSVSNIGTYISVTAGLGFDAWGPRAAGFIGAAFSVLGYTLTTLAASGRLTHAGEPIPYGWMALFMAIWQHGGAWADISVVATATRNFPNNRGQVIGLLKSCYGLSASIMALLYEGVFDGNMIQFLWTLTGVVPAVVALSAVFQTIVANHEASIPLGELGTRRVHFAFTLMAVMGSYILITAMLISNGVIHAGIGWCIPMLVLVLCALLVSAPVPGQAAVAQASAIRRHKMLDQDEAADAAGGVDGDEEEDLDAPVGSTKLPMEGDDEDGDEGAEDAPRSAQDRKTVWTTLQDLNFWLLCFAILTGVGAGLTVINNIAQIVEAADANAVPASYVITISIGNCLGRILYGWLSDIFRRQLNRVGWMAIVVASMAGAQLLMLFNNAHYYLFATFVVGVAYGGFWSVGPSSLADVFGMKQFPTLYTLASLAPAVGGYLASVQLAGHIYGAHADPKTRMCYGDLCFRDTYLILAGACVLGALAAAFSSYRLTAHFARLRRASLDASGSLIQ